MIMCSCLSALKVVPIAVKVRCVGWFCIGLLACCVPWFLLGMRATWSAMFSCAAVEVVFALGLCFYLWCRLPVGNFLVDSDLCGTLPFNGQRVLLSFDDGPTEGLTERVLDLLKERRVSASFFVLLHKAKQHPHLIHRIVTEGHVLGLHGEDHTLPLFRTKQDLKSSLLRAKTQLEELSQTPVLLFRPSHGVRTPALLWALRQAGLRLCMWDHGVWDTDAPKPEILLRRMEIVYRLPLHAERSRVLLLHDGKGDDPAVPLHAESLLRALTRFFLKTGSP